MFLRHRIPNPNPEISYGIVLPHKLLTFSLVLLVLMAGCVPEVVKYNAEGNAEYADTAYAEALESYRLAQVSEPDQPEPYYNAANTYNRQGDVAGTALQTDQALKASDPDLQTQAWYNLGNAYFDAQQWQEAVEAYKAALRLNPDDLDAKFNLELALRASQQQEQQQEQEQQSENQDSGNQEDADDSPSSDEKSEDAQSTPTPEEGTPQQSEDKSGAPTGEQQQPMTAEQAQQMLEALLGNSETLQEHLQQYFLAPGATPKEDW